MALQPLGLTSQIVAYNNEVDLKDKTAAPKMQGATVAEVLAFAGSVDGSNSVYVAQQGTAEESGVLLLQAYQDAIAKIASTVFPAEDIAVAISYENRDTYTWRGFAQENVKFLPGPEYQATFSPDGTPMQVLITIISVSSTVFNFDITDLDGNQIPNISGQPDFPAPAYAVAVPSTLIIAPGDYSIASDLILNNIVNVTSLTGQADVNISTSNVKVQSGANDSSNPISIVGLNLTTSLWIESNLSSLTFKNCNALGTNSFSIEPNGTGSISGTFIDCTGDFRSFGGGVGVTASGLFIRCKATNSQAFGGKGSTSGYFEYCGGAINNSNGSVFLSNNLFGSEGVTVNGYFYYCTANNASFASSNTGATNAQFYYCTAGNQSFGYRNTNNAGRYYNCTSTGNQAFGSNTQNGDTAPNARYYNCIAGSIAFQSTLSSHFYNCHAFTNWAQYRASDGGIAYNCYFGAFGGQLGVTGTGKYRNCLSDSFTIINLG